MASPLFLLGAGASFDAGLPLARELTKQMIASQQRDGRVTSLARALNYVVGTIVGYDSQSGARPDVLPDAERVVSAVELLSLRGDLEVAPFVDWQPTVEALENDGPAPMRAPSDSDFRDALRGSRFGASTGPDGRQVHELVKRVVQTAVAPRTRAIYNELHQALLLSLDELLRVDDAAVAYLAPLARLAACGAPVATLNYDVSLEKAARAAGFETDDGTSAWSETGTLTWHKDRVGLIKLHGSLSWARIESGRPTPPAPHVPVTTIGPRTDRSLPFLIFGRREKLRSEGPFLQLLEAFRAALTRSDLLVVIGYSFADDHINGVIAQWVNAGTGRALAVVDPHFPSVQHRWGRVMTFRDMLPEYLNVRDSAKPLTDPPLQSRLHIVRQSATEFLAAMGEDPARYIEGVATPQ